MCYPTTPSSPSSRLKTQPSARAFYETTLGLRFVSDDSFAIVMDANGTMIRIARVGDFTPLPFTILGCGSSGGHQHHRRRDECQKAFSSLATHFSIKTPQASGPLPDGPKVAWS